MTLLAVNKLVAKSLFTSKRLLGIIIVFKGIYFGGTIKKPIHSIKCLQKNSKIVKLFIQAEHNLVIRPKDPLVKCCNISVFGDSIAKGDPQFSATGARALLSLLNGFLLTTTYRGLIVVVSQNVQQYLGYTEVTP